MRVAVYIIDSLFLSYEIERFLVGAFSPVAGKFSVFLFEGRDESAGIRKAVFLCNAFYGYAGREKVVGGVIKPGGAYISAYSDPHAAFKEL